MKHCVVFLTAFGLVACQAQNRSPKICLPEPITPLLSSNAPADTTPAAFCFSDVVGAEPNRPVFSNRISVRATNRPTQLVAPPEVRVFINDLDVEDNTRSVVVKPNDQVVLRVYASHQAKTTTVFTNSIGTVSSSFSVTTK
jgi:hypothetical protein